jgi:hypothetical protein
VDDDYIQRAAFAGGFAAAFPLLLWLINRALYWGGFLLGRLTRKIANSPAGSEGREQSSALPRPPQDLLVERVEDSLPDR